MNKFFNTFPQFIWTWNTDNSTYNTQIVDAYGNVFDITISEFLIQDSRVNDTILAFTKWLKKPAEYNHNNPDHEWLRTYRYYVTIKQIKKVGE